MNKFYVYKVGVLACVKVKENIFGEVERPPLKLSVSKTASDATYWVDKKSAKTWEKYIKSKYPTAQLVECELKFKKIKP
jgi:hypothetical protein